MSGWLRDLVEETILAAEASGVSLGELSRRLHEGWGLPPALGGNLPPRVVEAVSRAIQGHWETIGDRAEVKVPSVPSLRTFDLYYIDVPSIEPLPETLSRRSYLRVGSVRAVSLEDAFRALQAECWTPEIRALLHSSGARLRSMMVGDVLVDGGQAWLCDSLNWRMIRFS